MNAKIKEVVEYNGHNLSANGAVNFNLKADYSELVNTIKIFQILNNDVKIKVKIPGQNEIINLGIFRVKQITIDGDGESKIKFNSLSDYVEMDSLNLLPLNTDDNKRFKILMESEIEEE